MPNTPEIEDTANGPNFASLGLRPELLSNLGELGYTQMTPIQAGSLPPLLAGKDVLAQAQTGSGKTAAFALGILNALQPESFRVQALVLCPTRELAEQVAQETRRLARAIANIKVLSLCGGVSMGPQIGSLQHSAHIIVGTPGRVLKHLNKGTLTVQGLQTFVLDEADRMLDMGFADEIDAILSFVPRKRQTALFSATYPQGIAAISARVQHDPQKIDVTSSEVPVRISQYWCSVEPRQRSERLLQALKIWGGRLNLVFCNTKIDCAELASFLAAHQVAAVALHGDLEQPERNRVLVRFANKSASVLIATDVAARGLDIKQLDAVFNFELPTQAEIYVHRIGRTGRAGEQGRAVSLVAGRETQRLAAIEAQGEHLIMTHKDLPLGDASHHRASAKGEEVDFLQPQFVTLEINGGKKHKLRPGDVLGALTKAGKIPGTAVGSIDLFPGSGFIAIAREYVTEALQLLSQEKVKGKQFRARRVE